MMFGGVEAGGTKLICVIGTGPDEITATARIEVAEPRETLSAAVRFFEAAVERGVPLDAIGIGSFGPVELRPGHPRYGSITATPKPGWAGTDVIGPFESALGVPVGFDTDVNAAALAEGRWGAARGFDSFVYLTVGTGIGGGAVVGGRVLHGLGHPEMGHIAVRRRPGDDFAGVCPFHGDCLEGMTSGPALAARFGRRAEALDGAEREAAVALIGSYVAAGIRSIAYVLAPERVVLGGGVSAMPGVVAAIRAETRELLRTYPAVPEHGLETFVVGAALGSLAGPAGTLILAEQTLRAAQAAD
jgi:fructokinase